LDNSRKLVFVEIAIGRTGDGTCGDIGPDCCFARYQPSPSPSGARMRTRLKARMTMGEDDDEVEDEDEGESSGYFVWAEGGC
jgi:hypothetical protein